MIFHSDKLQGRHLFRGFVPLLPANSRAEAVSRNPFSVHCPAPQHAVCCLGRVEFLRIYEDISKKLI